MLKIYISGKSDHSTCTIKKVESFLCKQEYLPDNKTRECFHTKTNLHEEFKQDIVRLLQCDVLYLLPGWENSSRSRLEYSIAKQIGKRICYEKQSFDILKMALLRTVPATWLEISGNRRQQLLVFARIIFAHHAFLECKNITLIAKTLQKSHSTISYYLEMYNSYYTNYKPFEQIADRVIEELNDSLAYFV